MSRRQDQSQEEETSCAICMGLPRNQSRLDSCNHTFCFRCINRWAKRQNNCPICRGEFSSIVSKSRRIRRFQKAPQIPKPRFYLGIPIFTFVVPMMDMSLPTFWSPPFWPNPTFSFDQLPQSVESNIQLT